MSKKSLLASTLITAMCIGATGGYNSGDQYHHSNPNVLNERRSIGAAAERHRKEKRKMAKSSRRKNRGKA